MHLLEHELGAPLFDRIRSGAALTDAGRAFLPHAEALLASRQDGVEAVSALRGGDRGTVTLAIVGTLASTQLTERLRRFREAFPAIDLRMRTPLSREVSELVRRADATLACATRPIRIPSSCRRRCTRSGWWRCARRAVGWRGRDA